MITYLWDFGDGNTSTEAAPTHEYTTAGTYTVSLTVSQDGVDVQNTSIVEVSPAEDQFSYRYHTAELNMMYWSQYQTSSLGTSSNSGGLLAQEGASDTTYPDDFTCVVGDENTPPSTQAFRGTAQGFDYGYTWCVEIEIGSIGEPSTRYVGLWTYNGSNGWNANQNYGGGSGGAVFYRGSGEIDGTFTQGSPTYAGDTWTEGDRIGMVLRMSNTPEQTQVEFFKNGVSQGGGTYGPNYTANASFTCGYILLN